MTMAVISQTMQSTDLVCAYTPDNTIVIGTEKGRITSCYMNPFNEFVTRMYGTATVKARVVVSQYASVNDFKLHLTHRGFKPSDSTLQWFSDARLYMMDKNTGRDNTWIPHTQIQNFKWSSVRATDHELHEYMKTRPNTYALKWFNSGYSFTGEAPLIEAALIQSGKLMADINNHSVHIYMPTSGEPVWSRETTQLFTKRYLRYSPALHPGKNNDGLYAHTYLIDDTSLQMLDYQVGEVAQYIAGIIGWNPLHVNWGAVADRSKFLFETIGTQIYAP